MPEHHSTGTDDATSDMVAQVAARVIAAMREEAGTASGAAPSPPSPAEIADQARQTAGGVVGAVQQQAVSRLDKQKEHAAEELASVAGTVRQMGDQLKQPEHGAVAQYAAHYGDVAADQLQQISGYLREHDVKQLVREVEGFARREPLLFTGGAFVLGLIGARFLKSKPLSAETPDSLRPDVVRDVASPVETVSPVEVIPPIETIPLAETLSTTQTPLPVETTSFAQTPMATSNSDTRASDAPGRVGFIAVDDDDDAVDEKFFRDQFADAAPDSGEAIPENPFTESTNGS